MTNFEKGADSTIFTTTMTPGFNAVTPQTKD
jgi:hypothetical protein